MENIDRVIALIAATGGLGLAAMSLVDAFKAIPGGGVSLIGFRHIRKVLKLFDQVLAQAAGREWETVVVSHWINGRSRSDQIGVIRSLLRLGLGPKTFQQLVEIGNVKADALEKAATKLVEGQSLTESDANVIGRVEAAVEARLDAAFDLADQSYRNASRVLAGVIAVALAVAASRILNEPHGWQAGVLVGLLAVPIAPIAKDLVSALTAAAGAVKTARKA